MMINGWQALLRQRSNAACHLRETSRTIGQTTRRRFILSSCVFIPFPIILISTVLFLREGGGQLALLHSVEGGAYLPQDDRVGV